MQVLAILLVLVAIDPNLPDDKRAIVTKALAAAKLPSIALGKPAQVIAAARAKKATRLVVVSDRTVGLETLADKLAARGVTMQVIANVDDAFAKRLASASADPPVDKVAIVFVLDHGFSMRGTKLARGKEVVREIVAKLALDDLVAVVTFESETNVVQPISHDKTRLAAAVHRISTGVGSNLFSGLKTAMGQLEHIHGAHKHVVVISDGDGVPFDGLRELAADMAAKQIDITAIGVGAEARPILDVLDGRYYELGRSTSSTILELIGRAR